MFQSAAVAFDAHRLAFDEDLDFNFNFFIKGNTVKIDMDDLIGDRMKLNILDDRREIRDFLPSSTKLRW